MQLRIRNAKIGTRESKSDELESGYFQGLNRHYQCIIRGRFKREGIPMIHTFSGQTFARRLKLPAPLILQRGVKIMSFFAPIKVGNCNLRTSLYTAFTVAMPTTFSILSCIIRTSLFTTLPK